MLDTLHNELGDTLAAPDRERRIAEVDEQNLNLTPVVRIDGPRTVEHSHTMTQGEAGAGANLCLEAQRQLQYQCGRNKVPPTRLQSCSAFNGSQKIQAGGTLGLVGR